MFTLTSFYPVLMVDDPTTSAAFYVEHFGFEETFTSDWYVSLRHGSFELAVLRHDHETIPSAFRTPSAGILLNVEVDDAMDAHRRLVVDRGLPSALDLRDEDFGQRHFIVEAPGGVLVDVIENIEVGEEYADNYLGA